MPMVNFHSVRVRSPGDFLDDSKAWATIEIKPGIELVTAKLKKDGLSGPMTAQAYRFEASKFNVQQAKQWLKNHKIKSILLEPAKPKPKEEVKETTMIANIAARVTEKCWGGLSLKKRKRTEVREQNGTPVAVSDGGVYAMNGSYESLRKKINKALEDSQLYGKYPEVLSTFPKKVFVSTDKDQYYMIDYTVQGDEVKLGVSTPIEKKVQFIIKEMAERCKVSLLNPLLEDEIEEFRAEKTEQTGNLDRRSLISGIAIAALKGIFEGGSGSGNWGHKGRPGKRGGSMSGGGKGGGGTVRVKSGGVITPKRLKDEVAYYLQTVGRGDKDVAIAAAKEHIGQWKKSGMTGWKEYVLLQMVHKELAHMGARATPEAQKKTPLAIAISGGKKSGGGKGGLAAHVVKPGVHASTFYDKSGGLKTSAYRKLTDGQKTAVLRHGIQKYKEAYVAKAQQYGLSMREREANKKVGALEGMRRAAVAKAKTATSGSKEERASLHIAISLQQRVGVLAAAIVSGGLRVASGVKVGTEKAVGGALGAV